MWHSCRMKRQILPILFAGIAAYLATGCCCPRPTKQVAVVKKTRVPAPTGRVIVKTPAVLAPTGPVLPEKPAILPPTGRVIVREPEVPPPGPIVVREYTVPAP